MRFLIRFSYNGLGFYGLVKQPGLVTVQDGFNKAFSLLDIKSINVRFVSRTDKNVSAHDQIYIVTADVDLVYLYRKLYLTLKRITDNKVIVSDIVNIDSKKVVVNGKVYIYRLIFTESAVFNTTHQYVDMSYYTLGKLLMYMDYLSDREFDYSMFCKQGKYNKTDPIQMIKIRYRLLLIHCKFYELEISISGRNFMYRQIRMLIGTLINLSSKFSFNVDNLVSRLLLSKCLYTCSAYPLILQTILFDVV